MAAMMRTAASRPCCLLQISNSAAQLPSRSVASQAKLNSNTVYNYPTQYASFVPNEYFYLKLSGLSWWTRSHEISTMLQKVGVDASIQDFAVSLIDWRPANFLIKVPPGKARAVRDSGAHSLQLAKLHIEQATYNDFLRARNAFPGIVGAPAIIVRNLPTTVRVADINRWLDGDASLAPVQQPITVHPPSNRQDFAVAIVRTSTELEAQRLMLERQGDVVGAGTYQRQGRPSELELAP